MPDDSTEILCELKGSDIRCQIMTIRHRVGAGMDC